MSPPHPSFALVGQSCYGSNEFPLKSNTKNLLDPWFEIPQYKSQTPPNRSPRRGLIWAVMLPLPSDCTSGTPTQVLQVFSVPLPLSVSLQLCPMPIRSFDGFKGCSCDTDQRRRKAWMRDLFWMLYFSVCRDNVNARVVIMIYRFVSKITKICMGIYRVRDIEAQGSWANKLWITNLV